MKILKNDILMRSVESSLSFQRMNKRHSTRHDNLFREACFLGRKTFVDIFILQFFITIIKTKINKYKTVREINIKKKNLSVKTSS